MLGLIKLAVGVSSPEELIQRQKMSDRRTHRRTDGRKLGKSLNIVLFSQFNESSRLCVVLLN